MCQIILSGHCQFHILSSSFNVCLSFFTHFYTHLIFMTFPTWMNVEQCVYINSFIPNLLCIFHCLYWVWIPYYKWAQKHAYSTSVEAVNHEIVIVCCWAVQYLYFVNNYHKSIGACTSYIYTWASQSSRMKSQHMGSFHILLV